VNLRNSASLVVMAARYKLLQSQCESSRAETIILSFETDFESFVRRALDIMESSGSLESHLADIMILLANDDRTGRASDCVELHIVWTATLEFLEKVNFCRYWRQSVESNNLCYKDHNVFCPEGQFTIHWKFFSCFGLL
jgi:hypothetical protein